MAIKACYSAISTRTSIDFKLLIRTLKNALYELVEVVDIERGDSSIEISDHSFAFTLNGGVKNVDQKV